MNIVMFSNSYLPQVGGVARSVYTFAKQLRRIGHRVLIVAPEYGQANSTADDEVRVPAIQHFNHSDFAVALPASGQLTKSLDDFKPDIVHSHHPFLLGNTALRVARYRGLPLVFTHHTLYENYTHYLGSNSGRLHELICEVSTHYANMANAVITPSESVRTLLKERGVHCRLELIPTGVDLRQFGFGNGTDFRRQLKLSTDAFVVGHVGRLAAEKNLYFLSRAVAEFVAVCRNNQQLDAHFLVLGRGPEEATIRGAFQALGLSDYLHILGVVSPVELTDAYHAMDVFAFSSLSETQGIVLAEAMAAGVPVVALDGPGVRDIVKDGMNGHLLSTQSGSDFVDALTRVANGDIYRHQKLVDGARATAKQFSDTHCAERLNQLYAQVLDARHQADQSQQEHHHHLMGLIKAELGVMEGLSAGIAAALWR